MKRNVEKSKATTTTPTKKIATVFNYFCSRHILITFVGITLLIVNYGVDTVQMSDVPHGSENSSNCKSKSINCNKSYNNNTNDSSSIVSTKNVCNINDTNNNCNSSIYTKIIWKRNDENIIKINKIKQNISDNNNNNNNDSNKNIHKNKNQNVYFLQIPLPVTPLNDNKTSNPSNYACDNNSDNYLDSSYMELKNFRKARIFGLLGTNFSLSYNLSIGTGNSAGNITIAAPAPAYYYAPAPYNPYGYGYGYNPYAYNPYAYNPYAYNPYAYNPYNGYGYYG